MSLFVSLLSIYFCFPADAVKDTFVPLSEIEEEAAIIAIAKTQKKPFSFERVEIGDNKLPYQKPMIAVEILEILKNSVERPVKPKEVLTIAPRFWQYEYAEKYHRAHYESDFPLRKLKYKGLAKEKLDKQPFIVFLFPRLSPLSFTPEAENQWYYLDGGFEPVERKSDILKQIKHRTKE